MSALQNIPALPADDDLDTVPPLSGDTSPIHVDALLDLIEDEPWTREDVMALAKEAISAAEIHPPHMWGTEWVQVSPQSIGSSRVRMHCKALEERINACIASNAPLKFTPKELEAMGIRFQEKSKPSGVPSDRFPSDGTFMHSMVDTIRSIPIPHNAYLVTSLGHFVPYNPESAKLCTVYPGLDHRENIAELAHYMSLFRPQLCSEVKSYALGEMPRVYVGFPYLAVADKVRMMYPIDAVQLQPVDAEDGVTYLVKGKYFLVTEQDEKTAKLLQAACDANDFQTVVHLQAFIDSIRPMVMDTELQKAMNVETTRKRSLTRRKREMETVLQSNAVFANEIVRLNSVIKRLKRGGSE